MFFSSFASSLVVFVIFFSAAALPLVAAEVVFSISEKRSLENHRSTVAFEFGFTLLGSNSTIRLFLFLSSFVFFFLFFSSPSTSSFFSHSNGASSSSSKPVSSLSLSSLSSTSSSSSEPSSPSPSPSNVALLSRLIADPFEPSPTDRPFFFCLSLYCLYKASKLESSRDVSFSTSFSASESSESYRFCLLRAAFSSESESS